MLVRWGVLVFVGALAMACVDLRYPPGAGRDGGGFVQHQQNGGRCESGDECQSGFCYDNVCCKTKCEGPCMTCRRDGNEGFCDFAPADMNPRGACKDMGCAQIPFCDGAGNCKKKNTGDTCMPATCLVNQLTLASRCNADGECVQGEEQACTPYFCSAELKCKTSCLSNDDCANGHQCVNGLCGAKALGTACADSSECVMDALCQNGVCCKTACEADPCRSCALPGSAGTCTPIPAGMAPTKMDACKAPPGASPCSLDGTCDGAGACRPQLLGKSCSQASCTNASLRNAGTCDGKGTCQVPPAVTCGGYTCGSTTTCRVTCMSDPECASPSVCGPKDHACGGLSAQYFRQTNLTDLAFMRTDPFVEFDWAGGSPSTLLNVDSFSVRWRGKITARFTEEYRFYVGSDDGEKLTVNNILLINRFVRHASVPEDVATRTIPLVAGQPVDIVLEYFENGGDANVRLLWESQHETKAIIPTSALAPQ